MRDDLLPTHKPQRPPQMVYSDGAFHLVFDDHEGKLRRMSLTAAGAADVLRHATHALSAYSLEAICRETVREVVAASQET